MERPSYLSVNSPAIRPNDPSDLPKHLSADERQAIVLKSGLRPLDTDRWYRKWRGLCNRSKRREISCTLTFKQFLKLVVRGGLTKPSQIGRSVSQYNLARKGDKGDYKLGNCRFVLSNTNREERVLNGRMEVAAEKLRQRPLAQQGNKNKSFEVTSPSGVVYAGTNLQEFSTAHDLLIQRIRRVCAGEQMHHRGWTGHYVNKERVVKPNLFQQKLSLKESVVAEHKLLETDAVSWYNKWRATVYSAQTCSLSYELTFSDYLTLANLAGIKRPNQIKRGGYSLTRINTGKGYRMKNCRFVLFNSRE